MASGLFDRAADFEGPAVDARWPDHLEAHGGPSGVNPNGSGRAGQPVGVMSVQDRIHPR